MATTGNIGRNTWGDWHPGFMTHAELVKELETATGDRRAELVREAKSRMKQASYPPFPEHLVPRSPDD